MMKNSYPLIYYPESFLDVLVNYDYVPKPPEEPLYPQLSSGLGKLFNGASDRKKMTEYRNKTLAYKKSLQRFRDRMKTYENDKVKFLKGERSKDIQYLISKSTDYVQNVDKKKGLSHTGFFRWLQLEFGPEIFESLSVSNSSRPDYYINKLYPDELRNYNTPEYESYNDMVSGHLSGRYITDFTLIRDNLKIVIEVDEPYSVSTREPYHVDDQKRNKFFLDNNWVIIRFTEEQVMTRPNLCCKCINTLCNGILNGELPLLQIPTNFRFKKWNETTIKNLINSNYREEYLEILKRIPTDRKQYTREDWRNGKGPADGKGSRFRQKYFEIINHMADDSEF